MNYMTASLRGDGRRSIQQNPNAPGHEKIQGHLKHCTLSNARRIVGAFQDARYSNHSNRGDLLWVIQEWCHLNHVQYKVEHTVFGPTGGYCIWRKEL